MLEKEILLGRLFPAFYDWYSISTGIIYEVIMFSDTLKKFIS